jgi:hypothetical protein
MAPPRQMWARSGWARTLSDAVTDKVDGIVARHLLLLQEIGGVALTFGKDRRRTQREIAGAH